MQNAARSAPNQEFRAVPSLQLVEVALLQLPSDQRRALLLSRVESLSYHEIADRLKSSIGGVKSLVYRATATLRRDVADALQAARLT